MGADIQEMKIAYIMNCLDKSEITPHTTRHNFESSNYPIDYSIFTDNGSREKHIKEFVEGFATHPIFNDENVGNPQALNNAMRMAFEELECDAVLIMGNDLVMREGWLDAAVRAYQGIKSTGIIGWSWRGTGTSHQMRGFNLNIVSEAERIFGSWFIPRTTWEKCGYFSEFSKYGCWDSTYNVQVNAAGLLRYYLVDYPSIHNATNDTGWYRNMKDEELRKGAEGNLNRIEEIKKTKKHYVSIDGILR